MNEEWMPLFAETSRRNEQQRLAENAAKAKLTEQIHEAREASEAQALQDARARLEADLHEAFRLGNPSATDDDWNRLKASILDDHFRRATMAQPVGTFARIRAESR